MSKEILVPDIGDFSEVDVIEVLVSVGDTISIDDELITLESDKASMDIPATEGGVVKEIKVAVGDKVKEGTELFSIYSPTLVNAQEEFLTALKRGGKKIIDSSKARLQALGISSRQINQLSKNREVSQLVVIYAKFDGYITKLNVQLLSNSIVPP